MRICVAFTAVVACSCESIPTTTSLYRHCSGTRGGCEGSDDVTADLCQEVLRQTCGQQLSSRLSDSERPQKAGYERQNRQRKPATARGTARGVAV